MAGTRLEDLRGVECPGVFDLLAFVVVRQSRYKLKAGDKELLCQTKPGGPRSRIPLPAARDGIQLEAARVPWINQQGHFALPHPAAEVVGPALEAIFRALNGEAAAQMGKRQTSLPGGFYHAPTGTFIETDETQHFTTFRLLTFELYPTTSHWDSIAGYTWICAGSWHK